MMIIIVSNGNFMYCDNGHKDKSDGNGYYFKSVDINFIVLLVFIPQKLAHISFSTTAMEDSSSLSMRTSKYFSNGNTCFSFAYFLL